MDKIENNQLQQQLKSLARDKGIASKAVGEAKKQHQPTELLIASVKKISIEINQLEATLKNLEPQSKTTEATLGSVTLPPQFTPPPYTSTQDTKNTVKIVSDISDAQWEQYVNRHPNATVYHSLTIRKVIEETFHHPCHYLAAIDAEGAVQGVLPLVEMKSKLFGHFIISLPYFNYGGVLASNVEANSKLMDGAAKLAKVNGADYIEYRHCHENHEMQTKSEKVAMLLNLQTTSEILWGNLGTKLRAQIKKSERYKPSFSIGGIELIDDFYKVFAQNMRDLGTPVYSKSLFINMLKYNRKSYVAIVYIDKKPVSCGFLLGWGNTMEIPWASTIREANKFDANMYLYWNILKFAIEHEFSIFDFGRSSKDASTYRFKKQWGAQPKELHWHYWLPNGEALPQINPSNPKYNMMIALWKKLPIVAANIIGPSLVAYIP
jgi:serine/alanine adding enzyme